MPDLSAYPNVFNTALVILTGKGWILRYDKARDWWFARKEDWELLADDPITLLGLVSIHEHHAPKTKAEYWWKIDEPDLLARFDPDMR